MIPSSIPVSARKVYLLDPWSKGLTQEITLVDICIKFFASSPELLTTGFLEKISDDNARSYMEIAPLDTPMALAIPYMPDGEFWRRLSYHKWSNANDVSLHNGSWRRLFLEKDLSEQIESATSVSSDLINLARIYSDFIHKLRINQVSKVDSSDPGLRLKVKVGRILSQLENLKELHLIFSVSNCGVDFEHWLFQVPEEDCQNLGSELANCNKLRLLSFQRSDISCKKAQLILNPLLTSCPHLTRLSLAHCSLEDEGGHILLGTLSRLKTLDFLDLTNNQLGEATMKMIHLLEGTSLRELILSLNPLGDKGGEALFRGLDSCQSLTALHVEGCYLGLKTSEGAKEFLFRNSKLSKLCLSVNRFGREGGEQLRLGVEVNRTIQHLDIRMTGIPYEILLKIWACVNDNKN